MKRLYQKNELAFALVWIALYVIVMNIALQFCDGFDNLASKTVPQMLVPVICIVVIALAATLWVVKHGLAEKYGLYPLKSNLRPLFWFLPLAVISCTNLKNGVAFPSASVFVPLLMAVNLSVGGYVEELIFRGFLFKAMAKDKLSTAIVVSSITFGVGHIVNVLNTTNILGVLLQVGYAMVIGFLYTVIVYKGGSLWPCIASHMFVNGSSVFAREDGLFTRFVAVIFGTASSNLVEACSAVLMILVAGSYTLWLWKKLFGSPTIQ